ncbi:MAG: helix-turn-helix domain-containing protein [Bdellovibrionales bacterium]
MDTIALTLANNLELLRAKRGLSQETLANLAGIPRSTVANIESGNANPSLKNLLSISSALGTGIDDLVNIKEPFLQKYTRKDLQTESNRKSATPVLPEAQNTYELYSFEINKNGSSEFDFESNLGKIAIHCLNNELAININRQELVLRKQQSLVVSDLRTLKIKNPTSKVSHGVFFCIS